MLLNRNIPNRVNPLFALEGEWDIHEERARRYSFCHLLDDEMQIRPGTRLYHGTWNPDLVFTPGIQTFFGAEPVIAMWYTLEEAESKEAKGEVPSDYSYVYEFEVIEPIHVDRYIDRIREHPSKKETCVHPQVALHGYNNYHALKGPFDLSIEITLMEKSRLSFRKKYRIDTRLLRKYVSYHSLIVSKSADELSFFKPCEMYPRRNKLLTLGK
jgi:hypothetical protein